MSDRVLIVAKNLEGFGSRLKQVAGDLHTQTSALSRQYQGLDWDFRVRAPMDGRIGDTGKQADRLAAEAERLAGALAWMVERYTGIDREGSRHAGALDHPAIAAGTGIVGAGILGAAAAAGAAAAVAAGAVGAVTAPAVAILPKVPEAGEGWTGVSAPPGSPIWSAPRPSLPGGPKPGHERAPTAEETKLIQWAFGVEEDTYGPKTKAVVAAIQRYKGMPVDSDVMIGHNTWNMVAGFANYRTEQVGAPEVPFASPLRISHAEEPLVVTSHWGNNPYDYPFGAHHGIDLIPAAGGSWTVTSATSGKIIWAGLDPRTAEDPGTGMGNVAMVQADDGTISIYGHLDSFSSEAAVGSRISASEPLGVMGSTGQSTGAHLHFEVWRGISPSFVKDGSPGWNQALRSTPPELLANLDPIRFLESSGVTLTPETKPPVQ